MGIRRFSVGKWGSMLFALSFGTMVVQTVGLEQTPFSQAAYDTIAKNYVTEGRVAYPRLKANRAELDQYVDSVGKVTQAEFDAWDDAGKIAFLLNAYNAITLKIILDHQPITKRSGGPASLIFPVNSVRQIPGAWDKITHMVLGRPTKLNDIEHEILRKKFKEPRIHMALVCGAKGCPPLRSEAYDGQRLSEQLDDQARTFLSNPIKFRIDREKNVVWLSQIFQWFGGDFLKTFGKPEGFGKHSNIENACLAFVSRYLSANDQAYLKERNYRVKYLDYDWSLNEDV